MLVQVFDPTLDEILADEQARAAFVFLFNFFNYLRVLALDFCLLHDYTDKLINHKFNAFNSSLPTINFSIFSATF